MEIFFDLLDFIGQTYNTIIDSWVFLVVKIFLFFYIVLLIVDIALLIYVGGGISKKLREMKYGSSTVVERSKYAKDWAVVRKRFESDFERHWKIAILESDHLISRALRDIDISGVNLSEQLAQMPTDIYPSVPDVRAAHEIRNAIVHDEDYQIEKNEAKRIVNIYYGFLDVLGAVPRKR